MPSKVRVPPQPLQISRRSRKLSNSSEDSSLYTPLSSPNGETILGLPMLGSIRGGILTPAPSSPSSPTFTPSASTTNLNVKFAPLPELAPRRRNSSTALGVASRGQMVRRRRLNSETGRQPYELDDEPPVLTPPPSSRPKARRAKSANSTPVSTPPDMHSFKKLWKKMSLSSNSRKDSMSSLSSASSTSLPVVRGSALNRSSSSSDSERPEAERRVGGAWEDPVVSAYSRPPPIIAEHVGLQKLKWIEKTEKEQEQLRECLSSNSTVSSESSSVSYDLQGLQEAVRA